MTDYKAPSSDDLNRLIALNRLLRQVNTEMQNINDETERFTKLLEKLGEVLKEHRYEIEDLQSSLSDYEDDLNRVKSIDLPEQQPNQVPGEAASIASGREHIKAER